MWPFNRKTNLPGIVKSGRLGWKFRLTDDEICEIQKVQDELKSIDGEFEAKEELAEEFERGLAALGLWRYAADQTIKSDCSPGDRKGIEFIDRAFASITKAYSLFPLPIYLYDLAYFLEITGKSDQARVAYENFLSSQADFQPNRVQAVILCLHEIDIDSAILDAKEKLSGDLQG